MLIYNDTCDDSSEYGEECCQDVPECDIHEDISHIHSDECCHNKTRPVLMDEMIEIHNQDPFAHRSLLTKLDLIANILNDHITDFCNPHKVTKDQVGLSNVDNTSDLDKPISNEAREEFDAIKTRLTKAEKDIEDIDREFEDRVEAEVNKIFSSSQFIINGNDPSF